MAKLALSFGSDVSILKAEAASTVRAVALEVLEVLVEVVKG